LLGRQLVWQQNFKFDEEVAARVWVFGDRHSLSWNPLLVVRSRQSLEGVGVLLPVKQRDLDRPAEQCFSQRHLGGKE